MEGNDWSEEAVQERDPGFDVAAWSESRTRTRPADESSDDLPLTRWEEAVWAALVARRPALAQLRAVAREYVLKERT